MSTIDVVLGLLLIWGTIQGIRQGFFSALITFIAYFIGIYFAIKFSHLVAEKLSELVEWNPKAIIITAFAITFIGIVILLFITAKFFTKLADWAYLGWINRLLGGVFGFFKYVLLLGICLLFFNEINVNNFFMSEETIDESFLYKNISCIAEFIYPSIKQWFLDWKENSL